MKGKRYGSPNMSDTTLLVSVEDLINMAMGPQNVNVVNFKMIQTVLHILARQLRMLETQVEIRVTEAPPAKEKKEKKKPEPPSTDSSSSKSPRKVSPPKKHMKEIKEEKLKPSRGREKERDDRAGMKEKEKAEKAAAKEKEKESKLSAKEQEKALKDKEKAERADAKEKDKADRAASKDREKAERAQSKEREKSERAESKEREKAERAESKEREKAEKAQSKEREKAERAESKEREKAEKAQSKEKEKAERAQSKEREKAERAESKEREKAEKAQSKDREKAERAQSKEREKAERAESKEREKAERAQSKERDKAERSESKEREKAERAALKEKEKAERAESRQREKSEKAAVKKREEAERAESQEREKAEKRAIKEKEKAERAESRERAKGEKARDKAERAESKEREKAEKSALKDKEKMEKMDAKDRAKAEKEREKLEKMDAKDRERAEREKEKADKAAAKEKEKLEKMSAKEREKYEKELERAEKAKAREDKEQAKKSRTPSGTAISIKEVERQKEGKVLIVEKGPTTRPTDSRTRVGSIEVVTLSQFEMLEAAVNDLKEKAGPLPFPALPDNQKLRSELAKGSASLTDTMQAMQVSARVQAAEAAIGRMAGLLTQLAAAGALPQDVAGKLEDVRAEMDAITEESMKRPPAGPPRKSVAIDPMSKKESTTSRVEARPSSAATRPSITSKVSTASRVSVGAAGVTHIEMDDALRSLKDDLTKNVNNLTAKATAAAEMASTTAKAVADKLDIALKLNTRINSLYSLVTDYAEQLSGFDAGLTTQMQSFQEQMAQMRNDLKGGITQLEQANNNSETAAVMELTERYEGLVSELDLTLHAHQTLTAFQKQLGDELHSLLECVEMLREQKADRDEVQDGLRDKADNSRLAGLLTEAEFALSRAELERRLDLCYDKFRKQEQVWMVAIRDLTAVTEGKAEIMQLLAARDDAQHQLRDIQEKLNKLALILGEPKAAMLTRQLSRGARCGACQVPALQEPVDISYGKPPPLPAVRPPPAGEEQPCVPEWRPDRPPDEREHTCHRWAGGSHTLLAGSVVREQAGPLHTHTHLPPTKRYTGYGSDGRLYMMEEELQPCVECNMISTDKLAEDLRTDIARPDGAGDGVNQTAVEQPQ